MRTRPLQPIALMNDDATLTLMSIGRCFVGALHGPSDKANDKVSVVNWNSGIRGAITQILQRTTLRASYRHAAQHKCCARALSPLWVINCPDGSEIQLPVFPEQRTSSDRASMSQRGQKATLATIDDA